MDEAAILKRVASLIEEERTLRDKLAQGELDPDTEHARLHTAEVELDQCWDLLRQRQARHHAGLPEDDAQARPESVVENYWQ